MAVFSKLMADMCKIGFFGLQFFNQLKCFLKIKMRNMFFTSQRIDNYNSTTFYFSFSFSEMKLASVM
jgi:hypothetical protein